MVVKNQRLLW